MTHYSQFLCFALAVGAFRHNSQNCEFISQNSEKKSQNCEKKSRNYLFFFQWRKRASIVLSVIRTAVTVSEAASAYAFINFYRLYNVYCSYMGA